MNTKQHRIVKWNNCIYKDEENKHISGQAFLFFYCRPCVIFPLSSFHVNQLHSTDSPSLCLVMSTHNHVILSFPAQPCLYLFQHFSVGPPTQYLHFNNHFTFDSEMWWPQVGVFMGWSRPGWGISVFMCWPGMVWGISRPSLPFETEAHI